MVISTSQAQAERRLVLLNHGVAVHSVSPHPAGVDAGEALRLLRAPGSSLRPRRGRRPGIDVVSEGETGRSTDRRYRADHPGGRNGGRGRPRHRLGRQRAQHHEPVRLSRRERPAARGRSSESRIDSLDEAAHRHRSDLAAVELVAALEAVGIRSILLKGPAFKRWLYAEGEGRHYWDIDLLVPPAELPRAESIAAGLGFEPLVSDQTRVQRESHHERWYRAVDNVCVELHRGFLGVEATDEELWDELVPRLRTVAASGSTAMSCKFPAWRLEHCLSGCMPPQTGRAERHSRISYAPFGKCRSRSGRKRRCSLDGSAPKRRSLSASHWFPKEPPSPPARAGGDGVGRGVPPRQLRLPRRRGIRAPGPGAWPRRKAGLRRVGAHATTRPSPTARSSCPPRDRGDRGRLLRPSVPSRRTSFPWLSRLAPGPAACG